MGRRNLADIRKALGRSQERVAEAVGVDRTTIGNWERRDSVPRPDQRSAYADALGITLEELDRLLSALPDPVGSTPVRLAQYLGSEQSAAVIRSHEPHAWHGLLQSPAYAAAIAQAVGIAETPETYVTRNVEQRAQRQHRINDGSLTLHVIQSEVALRLKMGTSVEMAAQQRRVIDLVRDPDVNVTVQVVPFTVGQYEALRVGAITTMQHPWTQGLSVYVRRYGSGTVAVEDPDEATNFVAILDHAEDLALSEADSLAFITEAAEHWERQHD